MTDEPVLTTDDIIDAALLYARCQAEETSPGNATLSDHPGCEDVRKLFELHAQACREQVGDLEALRNRRS